MQNVAAIHKHQYQEADALELTYRKRWTYIRRRLAIYIGASYLMLYETLRGIVNLFRSKKLDDVSGQLCLVTGGANGLGKALAMKFAKVGCDIAICDIVSYDDTVKEIQEKFKVKCHGFHCDIADNNSVLRMKEEVETTMGTTVDILVNNAGLLLVAPLLSTSNESIDSCIAVNLTSHLKVSF